jgi:hypothetical protein
VVQQEDFSGGVGADVVRAREAHELDSLATAFEARMSKEASFSRVEDELIEPSRLSDDAKSALWLYAWSFVDWRAQRREAYAHIAQIAEGTEALAPATERVGRSGGAGRTRTVHAAAARAMRLGTSLDSIAHKSGRMLFSSAAG